MLKPHHVTLGAEKADLTPLVLVGLQPLVALHGIVQRRIEGMQKEALEGFNFRATPCSVLGNNGDHVFGGLLAKGHFLKIEGRLSFALHIGVNKVVVLS